jgi:hypothetical protein
VHRATDKAYSIVSSTRVIGRAGDTSGTVLQRTFNIGTGSVGPSTSATDSLRIALQTSAPALDADGGLVLLQHSLNLRHGRGLNSHGGGCKSGVFAPIALHSTVLVVRSIVGMTGVVVVKRMICGRMVGLGRSRYRSVVIDGAAGISCEVRLLGVVSMVRY